MLDQMEGGVMARIVFDLDGTLIDSAPNIHGIANALLAEEGAQPVSLAQTRDFVGNGAGVFVQKMRAARGIADSEQQRLLEAFVARYVDAVDLTVPYPGAVEVLSLLKAQGHRLGICTNKPMKPCRAVLAYLGLDTHFDTVWAGDSMPVSKPDPAPLLAAFAELGEGPVVYVGDSDVDAETARRAKVPFVLYTEGYRKQPVDELPHDRAFSDFAALPGIIAAMVSRAA